MSLLEQNTTLRRILETRITHDPGGKAVPLDSFIDAATAEALYRHVRACKPQTCVEIGMANAISSMAILTALAENGGEGRLISVDPNQSTQWRNCGRASIASAGLASRHRVIEEPDSLALPRLLNEGTLIDFGYIDGWHTFDYALVDFWYIDKMMPKDASVAFNDCGWPTVEKTIKFVLSHRRYREIDVGLSKSYQRPEGVLDILRQIKRGRLNDYWRQRQDRYFVKEEAWEPTWNFYAPF